MTRKNLFRPMIWWLATGLMLLGAVVIGVKSQSEESELAPTQTHTLKSTVLQTTTGVTASCSTPGCTATIALAPTANIVCPRATGLTCTFYVLGVAAADTVSGGDNDFAQFLVDGVAPSPGPTLPGGFVPNTHGNSWAVVGKVTNTSLNQSHTVSINFGCMDGDPTIAPGCSSSIGPASERIDVFTP